MRAESSFWGASEKPSEHTEAISGLMICPFSAVQTHGCRDGDCGELVLLDPSARFEGDGQGHCCARGDGQLRKEHWERAHIPHNLCLELHQSVPLEITFQPKICGGEVYLQK